MIIEFQNVSKKYSKSFVLNDISFSLNQGEILGILGVNGSGKSTILKMISGLLLPTEGRIFVGGYDVRLFKEQSSKYIGYLPENNPLYLNMYILEFFEFIRDIYKIPKKVFQNSIDSLIDQLNLKDILQKKIYDLSKGYRQRIGIAKVILEDPKIFILDEPTTGLDTNQRKDIRNILIKQARKNNKGVIISTHFMEEVEVLCDRTLILNKGKKIADCSVKQLKEKKLPQISIKTKNQIKKEKLDLLEKFDFVKKILVNQNKINISLKKKSNEEIEKYTYHILDKVFDFIKKNNIDILEIKLKKSTLENILQEIIQENI